MAKDAEQAENDARLREMMLLAATLGKNWVESTPPALRTDESFEMTMKFWFDRWFRELDAARARWERAAKTGADELLKDVFGPGEKKGG